MLFRSTIFFEDCFFMECSFFANAHYTLDENHHLQVVPQEYDIRLRTEVNGVSWYNYEKNQYNSFKLYKDRDLNGSYIEAGDLVSGIKLLKSDCVEWAYVETATGRCGWLYFGEGCEMYFTSKPILPQTEAEISANTNYHHSEAADTRKYQIDLHHLVDELKHKRNEHHTTAKHKTTCHH